MTVRNDKEVGSLMDKKNKIELSDKDIIHLAKLANLNIKKIPIADFLSSISTILSYVSKIQKLNTKNTEETSQVTGMENVFRDDAVDYDRMLSQEEALSNAKKRHTGYFVIDAVFD